MTKKEIFARMLITTIYMIIVFPIAILLSSSERLMNLFLGIESTVGTILLHKLFRIRKRYIIAIIYFLTGGVFSICISKYFQF